MATIKPLVNYSGIIKESQTGDVVGVANGGTGATTLTSHGVLIGNGTSAIAATTAGTATATPPSGSGNASQVIGFATSATTLNFSYSRPVILA